MFLFHLAAVNNEDNIVDGDRGLGNVCREDDLLDSGWRRFEDQLLLLSAQGPVQRKNAETLLVAE